MVRRGDMLVIRLRLTVAGLLWSCFACFLTGVLAISFVMTPELFRQRREISEYVEAARPAIVASGMKEASPGNLWRALNPCSHSDRPEDCWLYGPDALDIRPPIRVVINQTLVDDEKDMIEFASTRR